jgi:hypothetical protein
MLGMVILCIFFQLALVVLQNGGLNGGWRLLLKEVAIVVSGLKPGVDAMRVVQNRSRLEHNIIDAKQELVFTKMIELFCESIPG